MSHLASYWSSYINYTAVLSFTDFLSGYSTPHFSGVQNTHCCSHPGSVWGRGNQMYHHTVRVLSTSLPQTKERDSCEFKQSFRCYEFLSVLLNIMLSFFPASSLLPLSSSLLPPFSLLPLLFSSLLPLPFSFFSSPSSLLPPSLSSSPR